jgi:hypothetical protein
MNFRDSANAKRMASGPARSPGTSAPQHCLKNVETNMAVCQNLVPLVNIKIAGKWMFIPLKMVCIGIDP